MSGYKPRLDDDRLVAEALGALAEETEGAEASPAVEQRLRAAFRGEGVPAPASAAPRAAARPDAWKWIAAVGTAAGFVWLAYAWRQAPTAVETPAGTALASRPAAPASTAPVVPARAAVERRAEPRTARVADDRREPARRARRAPTVERFEPLYPGDVLAGLDAVHVVRLSVPRSSLAALGWPARPGQGGRDPVEIDAMVGPDGMTRAVRFISQ